MVTVSMIADRHPMFLFSGFEIDASKYTQEWSFAYDGICHFRLSKPEIILFAWFELFNLGIRMFFHPFRRQPILIKRKNRTLT